MTSGFKLVSCVECWPPNVLLTLFSQMKGTFDCLSGAWCSSGRDHSGILCAETRKTTISCSDTRSSEADMLGIICLPSGTVFNLLSDCKHYWILYNLNYSRIIIIFTSIPFEITTAPTSFTDSLGHPISCIALGSAWTSSNANSRDRELQVPILKASVPRSYQLQAESDQE